MPELMLSNLENNLSRGLSLYAAGRPRLAFREFSLVLDEDPANVLGHYLCGLALRAVGLSREANSEWKIAAGLPLRGGRPLDAAWAQRMSRHLLEADTTGEAVTL